MKKITIVFALFLCTSFGFSQTLTFTDNGGNYVIQDNNCDTPLNLPLSVTGVGILGGLYNIESVVLNIFHQRNEDVFVELIDPSGTVMLTLVNDDASYGGGFVNCVIRDSGVPLPSFSTVVTGTFMPSGSGTMNDFNTAGVDADGDWSLRVCDDKNNATGAVNDWSITFVPCEIPIATITVVSNCPVDTDFTMEVDITDIGSASGVTITDDQGTAAMASLGVGTYSYGSYTNGTNVLVTVTNDDNGSCSIFGEGTFNSPCPPENDLCVDAISVSCGGQYTGNTDDTTNDDQGINCGGENDSPEVWYSYTGTGSPEHVNLSLCNSTYDTFITVYSGSCGALTCMDYNDDNCYPTSGSSIEFLSDGTTTYYFAVEGFNGATGDYVLDVTCVSPPANDLWENATTIECGGEYDGTLNGATNTDQGVSCGTENDGPEVWYSFTIPSSSGRSGNPATSWYKLEYQGGWGVLFFLQMFKKPESESMVCHDQWIKKDGSSGKFLAEEGQTYLMRLGMEDSGSGATDDFTFTIACVQVPAPPANDTPENAEVLVLNAEPAPGDLTDASMTLINPSCSSPNPWKDVWYNLEQSNADFFLLLEEGSTDPTITLNVTIWDNANPPNELGCFNDVADELIFVEGFESGNIQVWSHDNVNVPDSGRRLADEETFTIAISDNLSTPSFEKIGFQYFPNPVTRELALSAQSNIQNVTVYNILGQEMLIVTPNAMESNVDMSGLQTGMYFIKVRINDITETIRVIKR